MGWLIGFIVVAFVVAPIMWVMPSPAQKRQARLRERAQQLGLAISLVDLPQSHRSKVRKEAAAKGVAYSLRMQRERNRIRPHWFVWREAPDGERDIDGSCPEAVVDALPALRARMGADMVGFGSTPEGYVLYWRERGDETTVEQVAMLLEDIRQLAGGTAIGRTTNT